MPRSTTSQLILRLRSMTDASVTEWTNGTANFWDDDQLELVLDAHRVDFFREALEAIPAYATGGTVTWTQYQSAFRDLEATDGGTAVFIVETGPGADVSSANYTVDYQRGLITFTTDTEGTAYLLTARAFDLNQAAADIWRRKAAHAATRYDFSTDNHSMKRSQYFDHCLKMAEFYASGGGEGTRTLYVSRSDTDG